jgi:hypothetical protein
MGPERWKKLGAQLVPYSRGDKIILCGQVPWDASVDHVDHKAWLIETAQKLKAMTTRPIVFRPHPLAIQALPAIRGLEYSVRPLTEDLKDAHCVVTFNSNSAVEALIAGKPVFAFDEGSMVWEVANRSLSYLEEPTHLGREQWANNLAFAQWTPAEMAEGKAWAHLTR